MYDVQIGFAFSLITNYAVSDIYKRLMLLQKLYLIYWFILVKIKPAVVRRLFHFMLSRL